MPWSIIKRLPGRAFPAIGSVVRIVPNHTCVVSNLFDRMVFHRDGVVTRVEACRRARHGLVRPDFG
jgi:D-serine deaminase-like pyridoxal phosphate-dependent protein